MAAVFPLVMVQNTYTDICGVTLKKTLLTGKD